ncbi:MAG: conjugal transfer protein TraR [Chloroflexota bacterium]|jgi:DnaK suppressor protein
MLSESDLTEFRELLDGERSDLEARLQTLERRLARDDHFNESEDLGDSATQVLNKEELLSERSRTLERLRGVDQALARIEEGTYGISSISGKPIPIERLRAMPTATKLVGE